MPVSVSPFAYVTAVSGSTCGTRSTDGGGWPPRSRNDDRHVQPVREGYRMHPSPRGGRRRHAMGLPRTGRVPDVRRALPAPSCGASTHSCQTQYGSSPVSAARCAAMEGCRHGPSGGVRFIACCSPVQTTTRASGCGRRIRPTIFAAMSCSRRRLAASSSLAVRRISRRRVARPCPSAGKSKATIRSPRVRAARRRAARGGSKRTARCPGGQPRSA